MATCRLGRFQILLALTIVLGRFGHSQGACVLPEDIRGFWISSDKGLMNFTADSLVQYPIKLTSPSSITLTCNQSSGNTYLLKSTETFTLFSVSFSAYLCLQFHKVSPYKYWYFVGNEFDSNLADRLVVKPSFVPIDLTSGCDRLKPYAISTFNTLVKEGALQAGLVEATCPYELLHTFSNGSLMTSTKTESCTNVTLDVCKEKTRMIHTYDPSCKVNVKFAVQGTYICLQYFANDTSKVTYLHVWNNDTTLNPDIRRINCYAYVMTDDTMISTLYPGSCKETQTGTSVSSPGIFAVFNTITKSCQKTIVYKPEIVITVSIISSILVFLLLVALVACITYKTKCICVRKLFRKLCKQKSVKDSTTSLASSTEDGFGSYLRSVRRGLVPGVFVARKPVKIGPTLEPYMVPPTKVELLYNAPPSPTSPRFMMIRSLFQSQISLRCNE